MVRIAEGGENLIVVEEFRADWEDGRDSEYNWIPIMKMTKEKAEEFLAKFDAVLNERHGIEIIK